MANNVINPIIYGDYKTVYVGGEGVEFTLLAANWNGTTYSLDITGYSIAYPPQLGLPTVSDYSNTKTVVKSALTIPEASGSTVVISCIQAPTVDVRVAIFGLTATAATAEGDTE